MFWGGVHIGGGGGGGGGGVGGRGVGWGGMWGGLCVVVWVKPTWWVAAWVGVREKKREGEGWGWNSE